MLAFKSSVLKNVGTIYNAINRTLKLVKNTWTHFNLYLILSVFLKIIRKWKVYFLTRDSGKLKPASNPCIVSSPHCWVPYQKCFHPTIRSDVSPHFSSRWIGIHSCPFSLIPELWLNSPLHWWLHHRYPLCHV